MGSQPGWRTATSPNRREHLVRPLPPVMRTTWKLQGTTRCRCRGHVERGQRQRAEKGSQVGRRSVVSSHGRANVACRRCSVGEAATPPCSTARVVSPTAGCVAAAMASSRSSASRTPSSSSYSPRSQGEAAPTALRAPVPRVLADPAAPVECHDARDHIKVLLALDPGTQGPPRPATPASSAPGAVREGTVGEGCVVLRPWGEADWCCISVRCCNNVHVAIVCCSCCNHCCGC
jgi:hypothetical protein